MVMKRGLTPSGDGQCIHHIDSKLSPREEAFCMLISFNSYQKAHVEVAFLPSFTGEVVVNM